MMTRLSVAKTFASALALALGCGTAFGQVSEDTSMATPASAAQNSVKLVRVIVDIPLGTPWLTLGRGIFCSGSHVTNWASGRTPQQLPLFATSFKTELEKKGFKVITPGQDNLFDEGAGASDYEAAAVITDEHIEGCSHVGQVKGDSTMKIDWQIYSRIKKQVVAHVSTTGTAHLDDRIPTGLQQLVMGSFASNTAALAMNADFRAAMAGPRGFAGGLQTPDQQSKIVLSGSLRAGPRKIADAVESVVTIMDDIGSGSGVLVSSDGYILTDAHVVGDGTQTRVRWSDGIETLGVVVRVSKRRDVAIIKTNPRDRTPLAIKHGPVTPGQRVYAIGSPKSKDFQGTVSSGVVSADRVFNGLRYIQSDTVVSPGSSGGPLLDESGSIIGLTDLGFQNDGPAGLNLFTPIGDAMDFLSLEQQPDNPGQGLQAGR